MSDDGIPSDVRQFILERVDSVEMLEVLFLMRSAESRHWDAQSVSNELRTNPVSTAKRLTTLHAYGVIELVDNEPSKYRYAPISPSLRALLDRLYEAYQVRKVRVLSLMFSPMKKALDISAAFDFSKKGDNRG